jgi:hypothetical protein
VHGDCDDGIGGNGECKPNTCETDAEGTPRWIGNNCDQCNKKFFSGPKCQELKLDGMTAFQCRGSYHLNISAYDATGTAPISGNCAAITKDFNGTYSYFDDIPDQNSPTIQKGYARYVKTDPATNMNFTLMINCRPVPGSDPRCTLVVITTPTKRFSALSTAPTSGFAASR